ncbi:uncharacterized protein [Hoplias malabaricus]|uniref:uncharacterized protein n=1 Tax=Hoplias malabaricus TaxID=27720 RepID=UPI0034619087
MLYYEDYDDADSSRRLQVQIDPLGVHTEQHMFSQQLFSLEPDSAPLLCGLIPAHPWGPCCSPQKDRGLPTIKKPPQSFLCIAGGASLQPVSSRNTKEKVQFLPLKTQRCVNQPFPPDQTQLPAQTLLHPKPHVNQSSASSMQAPHPGHLGFPSIQSQSSPQILPDPLNCAVIRPRMCGVGDDDKDTPCQNKAGEDEDGVTVWYQLQLEKQKRLREKLNLQKEKRRHMQAQNRWKQRQEKLQDVSPTLLEKKGQQDQTPLQYPQKPQGNKQIRSIPNLPETPTSNLPQHQQRCSFNSKSHSNPQKCGRRQQQQPSLLLPPLLKPRSKQGYPPAPLAHSLTAELVCEGTGEKHRRRSRKLRKRMVKDLPLKVRVVKHSRLEEKDDGMSVWVPAQANKGSRVVTFTRTQSYGRDTFRQLNNSHQPVKQ